jgi:4-amino-4-deoxy-L-arabinose transferase-like glycosyltransferase
MRPPQPKVPDRPGRSLLTGWLLAALALAATLAWRPLSMPDESRYLGIAAAMWHSGDWAVPRLDGLPFFHKPPLFYWLAALAYGLGGETIWIGRLASWCGAVAAAAALLWLLAPQAAEADEDRPARWALAALVAQPLWWLGAQFANMDMLVAGCISVAICALAVAARDDTARGARWIALLALGAGFLAKGLIGVVLPGAVIVVWLLVVRRADRLLRLLAWPGWLLLPGLVLPWLLAVEQRHPGFLHYFIVVQHFQRYTAHGFNNVMPFWFYPAALLLLMLPWSPLLAAAGVARWRAWRAERRAAPAVAAAPGLDALGWSWLGVITLFFSLPASKLVGYILPVVPAAALLIGLWLARQRAAGGRWRRVSTALLAGGLMLCIIATGAVARFDRRGNGDLAAQLRPAWQPGDRLLYWQTLPYDLPLLLAQSEPVPVVLRWNDPAALGGDGWERELADAGRFDPAAAARLLRLPSDWPALRCAAPRTWVISRVADREAVTRALGMAPQRQGRQHDATLVVRPTDCPVP